MAGEVPRIDDSRVSFIKGWFEETLPGYDVPDREVLVITLDADLYSASIFVLRELQSFIRPGTDMYFDELTRVNHEPRAFDEFMEETGRRFRLVATEATLSRTFFQCTS